MGYMFGKNISRSLYHPRSRIETTVSFAVSAILWNFNPRIFFAKLLSNSLVWLAPLPAPGTPFGISGRPEPANASTVPFVQSEIQSREQRDLRQSCQVYGSVWEVSDTFFLGNVEYT